jgi:hypothetical protein
MMSIKRIERVKSFPTTKRISKNVRDRSRLFAKGKTPKRKVRKRGAPRDRRAARGVRQAADRE